MFGTKERCILEDGNGIEQIETMVSPEKEATIVGVPADLLRRIMLEGVIISSPHLCLTQRWTWIEGWLYAISAFLCFVLSRIWAENKHPGILRERQDYAQHKNTKEYDKVFSPLMAIGIILLPVFAGLDNRFSSSPFRPVYSLQAKMTGAALVLLSFIISSYALIENPFFSAMMRIQDDRGSPHRVIITGPYGWVRHPAYSSVLLIAFGTPVVLDSVVTLLPAVVLTVVTFLRTYLEDEALQKDLKGYEDYTHRTRYRLIPCVW